MAALPYRVKAVYDYSSPHDDDLSFSAGQVIIVTEEEDAEWYIGEYTADDGAMRSGLFPRNFVERYEPQAPPRPARSRTKPDAQPQTAPTPANTKESEPDTLPITTQPDTPAAAKEPQLATEEPPTAPKNQHPEPASATGAARPPPPETASKPNSSSFRDRIAAFNKPAAPPVAPKPSGAPTSQTFIKKPFVAPPPARNAYVPTAPKQDAPQKVYRRDEDPEIAQRKAQDQRDAEEAGLAGVGDDDQDAETPQTTSLKDRIALLQKQQQEQATRRAESSMKSKRPAQPRTESEDAIATDAATDRADIGSPYESTRVSIDAPKRTTSGLPAHGMEDEEVAKETISDGNEADQSGADETTEDAGGDSTEVEEAERARPQATIHPPRTSTSDSQRSAAVKDDRGEEGDEEDVEEAGVEDVDPETRRKEELRARMAKMSGGMGMPGMFGMPPPRASAPARKSSDKRSPSTEARSPPPQQRIPIVPMPGVPRDAQSLPAAEERTPHVEKVEEQTPLNTEETAYESSTDAEDLSSHQPPTSHKSDVPRALQDRPAPTQHAGDTQSTVSTELFATVPQGRPVPPPPPRGSVAEKSDDSDVEQSSSVPVSRPVIQPPPPPIPGLQTDSSRRELSKLSGEGEKHEPNESADAPSIPTPPSANARRVDRAPPIPISSPQMPPLPPQGRPLPPRPPPPTAVPRRQSMGRKSLETSTMAEERDSEYEGDYDTDIAPTANHKDALTSRYAREASVDDDSMLSEETSRRPAATQPPPIPNALRTAPPPPPSRVQSSRKSTEHARAPPLPPPRHADDDEDYDPYRYDESPAPSSQSPTASFTKTVPQEPPPRGMPPMLPPGAPHSAHNPPPPPPPPPISPESRQPLIPAVDERTSVEEPRRSTNPPRRSMTGRRSMDPGNRPHGDDGGQIARDIDLAEASVWWAQPNTVPPTLQGRSDILIESEESTAMKRGGRSTTSRDIYVLFQDYSQTIITAQFDTRDPSHEAHLEQRHEAPPAKLRQDQLEDFWAKHGEKIAAAASSKQGQSIGDGAPQTLVLELLQAAGSDVILPVGTTYGALVYANMANSSVSQYDEIRAGDIVTFRNAKFKGKYGSLHAKYSQDVGKPDHVAVVLEWDGTKKKIRALEQGREKEGKKAKVESFRVGDLAGGEIRVWRVVGRNYVGWDNNAQ